MTIAVAAHAEDATMQKSPLPIEAVSDPEQTRNFGKAYDLACDHLRHKELTGVKNEEARKIVAYWIVELAPKRGIRPLLSSPRRP